MKASEIKQIVHQELSLKEPFENFHGITRENLHEFLVSPYPIHVDPDDMKSQPREMWVVLHEGKTATDGYIVIYDPLLKSWGFAEQLPNGSYCLVCGADSLSTALSSM